MSITPRASRAAVTEVYNDLQKLVENTALRFAKRYNRDFEDTIAEANLHFLEAYHKFDPEYGTTIEQRVVYIIWNRLLQTVRAEAKKSLSNPAEFQGFDLEFVHIDARNRGRDEENILPPGKKLEPTAPTIKPFDLEDFKSEVSEDAEAVIKILMESPLPLEEAIRSLKKPTPHKVRWCLRRYLVEQLKWGAARVTETFREIGSALK